MTKLNILKNMGFKISWKLISIGLFGYDEIPILLNHNDVIEHLNDLLTNIDNPTDNIIALFIEKDNLAKFNTVLTEFASKDNSDIDLQKRKWRVYILKNTIDNISKDCLQGMLELMEFWISFGLPEDCPQSFPNKDSIESIQSYFTEDSYKFNLEKNIEWIEKETLSIIKSENSTVV